MVTFVKLKFLIITSPMGPSLNEVYLGKFIIFKNLSLNKKLILLIYFTRIFAFFQYKILKFKLTFRFSQIIIAKESKFLNKFIRTLCNSFLI